MTKAVIGAGAGFGRYLADILVALPFRRGDELAPLKDIETIIFCAASASFQTPFNDLASSMHDNLLLLDELTKLKPKRFVFVSSCDVYPKGASNCTEGMDICIEELTGGYACFKLMSEALVKDRCRNHLILRPTSLFGPNMRPNNIVRLVEGTTKRLSLSADSTFNCISYDMLADFVSLAEKRDLTGTYNCAAKDKVILADIAHQYAKSPQFGDFSYHVPNVDISKISAACDIFDISSIDVLKRHFKTSS